MTVHLVGAGPGDPGLITVRGAELLARADVVVHDRLSARELLDLAPPDAELIDVGKSPDGPSTPQSAINELLVERGRRGQTVVRLKGGDPFVFARGAEEAAALAAAGVDYEVVPGITSALAVPAYAGIPVTLRYSSTSVTIVTGHEDPSKGRTDVGWEALARVGGTIVVLMGVRNLPRIAERLVAGGLSPDTPAAAIRWGTRPTQQTVRATLSTLADHDLASPATIVIGDVAGERLDWFERRPLLGRTVVVTRTRDQSPQLARRLRDAGAEVLVAPTIAVEDPADGAAALRDAVSRISTFDWVVLTSPNGAARFAAELRDGRDLAGVSVAVIGPGTAAAIAEARITADLVPPHFVAESLLDAFPDPPPGGGRVLLARAAVARDVLPDGLAARGWDVEVVEAYRTVGVSYDDDTRARVRAADAVTFTSSSTAEHFVAALGGPDAAAAGAPPVVACIGPVTAATARELGLEVTAEAAVYSIDGLVDAVVDAVAGVGVGVVPGGSDAG
ncbi:MAG TPA: uroporphyrinogen-III C-methyltransferase [Microthrixaceae bacterium]|nr:uroporphyrinogen-III C-methyltransferase [Microthrixaceae bacterium]HNE73774.1 uroporphyrinogen-III C-methyltransferase [Microthrixaceae bacterium]HNL49597.1 uroporphyrinogen-III C-methyltransferase [Microthrixaceae bacterium]HNN39028.1 uroporphyrinogen-III C-methyltransferase [Microthrixaceae bacterium]